MCTLEQEFFISSSKLTVVCVYCQAGGKGKGGKGGKFGIGKSKKHPQSRSARAGLQVSNNNNDMGWVPAICPHGFSKGLARPLCAHWAPARCSLFVPIGSPRDLRAH